MTDLNALVGKRVRVTRRHQDLFNGAAWLDGLKSAGFNMVWEGRLVRVSEEGHLVIVRDDRTAIAILGHQVTVEEAVTEVERLAAVLRDLAARDVQLGDDNGTTVARHVLQAGYVRGVR